MGLSVGQAKATFHLHPEAAAQFASSSKRSRGRSRQDANFVRGYKRMKYGQGGEKGK